MKFDVFWAGRAQLAESPLCWPKEAAFYWVGTLAGQVWRHDGSAQKARYWQLNQDVGCIALLLHEDGLHCASLVAAAPHGEAMRFNEGRCDRQGHFWIGSMNDRQGNAPELRRPVAPCR
ncbi:SMP-30/gluconolactonase/LRE family protein [Paucibacter sp. AS339]|uniref:SMP-30/gluconolactonase/LRE family protein n=1 Tax=Paucibacter hankyongi TaxID=3133434 RepID=UPI003096117B